MRKALVALVVLGAVAFVFPAHARAAVGRFVIRCSYSHTLADDPIVHFGQPGASHMHDFYGNVAEDAFSTVDTMVGQATTCKTPTDPSGYWVPTTLINGVPLRPIRVITYWEAPANQNVETIPLGLQMIAGDHDSMVPQSTARVGWACDNDTAGVIHSPVLDHPYDCTPYNAAVGHGNGVVERAIFPSCWDGTGLTPADVTYPPCRKPYTHKLIRLTARFHLGIMSPDGLTLSSGPYTTLHFDFFDAFDPGRLQLLVGACLNAHVNCKQVTN